MSLVDLTGLVVRVDVQPLLPSVLTGADAAVLLAVSPQVEAAQAAYAGSTASAEAATRSNPRGVTFLTSSAMCSTGKQKCWMHVLDIRIVCLIALQVSLAQMTCVTLSSMLLPRGWALWAWPAPVNQWLTLGRC
jgi:hypothetical protein